MLESAVAYAGIRMLAELPLEGRRVFVRADFDSSEGLGEDRLRLALPTLEAARSRGARVIVASALSRPSTRRDELEIEPVAARLAELLGAEVFLPDECVGDAARKVTQELRPGQLCVLENLGTCAGEAENDRAFAERLAAFADVYVNDAFGACHLSTASLDAAPRLVHDRGMGLWLEHELRALDRLGRALERPFFAAIGGPATREALALLESLLGRATAIGLGGALGSTLVAASGAEPPAGPVAGELFAEARAWLRRARDRGTDVRLPVGEEPFADFGRRAAAAKTVLWSGALGSADGEGTEHGSVEFARSLAESAAFRVVLDGPLVRALANADPDLVPKIGFISSGGKASLEYIEGRPLPALETLRGGAT